MPATRQKKRQDKVGRNEEEGSPGQRKLARAAREIRRFFETGDAVLDQNIVPFINQLAPDVNFTADEAEQTSPYSIDWVGNTKRFAKAVKSFRALAKKEKYDVPEDSGLNIKHFQKETSDEEEPTRQKKAVSIEEDLDMRKAMNEEDSSADDSSEEQDNIWPLLYQKVNPQSLNRPGWRALQQDCVLHGCDFADVKFRLEFLLTHENSEETPNELLHSARKWIGTCPQALEYLDNDFYGDREMSKRFSAYRSKHRRVARIVSSRSTSADHEKLDRVRLTSVDPEADRRELGFIDRTVPADGSDQITLEDDPDDPEADSVTGTIVMSVSHFLGVKLDSLNEEYPHAERHVLVKQSDCTSKRCPQSKITRASDKDSLKNLKRSDISVVNFVSAKDDNNDRWPRTYVVGYIKKKRDEGLRVWSRSIFRNKFGSTVDDEINAARRQCGQQEICKR
ncbi:uncharacterized protein PpBr36_05780 [Pyricularia pennisetigena]|uniref:uncharacterized protein n=1 Tax=Pyricularia pennisetigena TaxID=1578925 RepID=UPI001150232F|nr:uncharacterized protein PpBr36_05780 [Pyricularia pennisetigena]TLS23441.1 hypothetical protein PpBr36_05780 [Pyricularia pennisetigena]